MSSTSPVQPFSASASSLSPSTRRSRLRLMDNNKVEPETCELYIYTQSCVFSSVQLYFRWVTLRCVLYRWTPGGSRLIQIRNPKSGLIWQMYVNLFCAIFFLELWPWIFRCLPVWKLWCMMSSQPWFKPIFWFQNTFSARYLLLSQWHFALKPVFSRVGMCSRTRAPYYCWWTHCHVFHAIYSSDTCKNPLVQHFPFTTSRINHPVQIFLELSLSVPQVM